MIWYFHFWFKDKSRLFDEKDEFQLESNEWELFSENKITGGVRNHDVCLIKTPKNVNGAFFDLSTQFDQIPCLAESFSLEEVSWIKKLNENEIND